MLLVCLGSLFSCITKMYNLMARRSPTEFSCRQKPSLFHQLQQIIQILKQKSSPNHHTTTTTMFVCRHNIFFWNVDSFTPAVTGPTPSDSSTIVFPRVLWNFTDVFDKHHLCCFGVAVGFSFLALLLPPGWILDGVPLVGYWDESSPSCFLPSQIMALTVVHWSPKAL